MTRAACALAAAMFATGCDDTLDQRLAIIDQPRVLAVISEPAEARPGAQISYRAIVASPGGTLAAAPRWAYCTAPKPPTEDNTVSEACLGAAQLIALGDAPSVTGMLPSNGCLQFGPETPPGNFRPRDPDASGGYYQPVRAEVTVDASDLLAFGHTRIICNLPTAPFAIARAYDLEYAANQNPVLDPIAPMQLPADSTVALTASWPATAAERYLYYDAVTQTLVQRREAMRLSWFATGGSLAADTSFVSEDQTATGVSTTWRTPGPGLATLWLVLRDSRGGIAAEAVAIEIQ